MPLYLATPLRLIAAAVFLVSFHTNSVAADPATPDHFPSGTKVTASFLAAGDKSADQLIDGDPRTALSGAQGIAHAGAVFAIDLKFPAPLANLSGVSLGPSDKFGNYFPKEIQFWADSDGNGTFDTLLGQTRDLGPNQQTAGVKFFQGRMAQIFGLRLLISESNVAGTNRPPILSEISPVLGTTVPLCPATPTENSDALLKKPGAKNDKPVEAVVAQNVAQDASLLADPSKMPGSIFPLPGGTKITSNFPTGKGQGPDKLFDGDLATMMTPGGNTAREDSPSSVFLKFPAPVKDVGGVETGASDPYGNYFPKVMQFWADGDGDGRFETRLGETNKLGPNKLSIGRHMFSGRLPQIYGLEIRVTDQNIAGAKRAFFLNEMRLLQNPALPILAITPLPDAPPRDVFRTTKLPLGTTATITVATVAGQGAEALLDGDDFTFVNPNPGTAVEGRPVSIFLRFDTAVSGAAGVYTGRTDPFANYYPKTMEVYADTTGDGKYESSLGRFTNMTQAGNRMFTTRPAKIFGLELRVVEQNVTGNRRAFMMNSVQLVMAEDGTAKDMRYVLEDFEDFGTWRTWGANTNGPGENLAFGNEIYLTGARQPAAKQHNGQGVGVWHYTFNGPASSSASWAQRAKIYRKPGVFDRMEFDANPQGISCNIRLELHDARDRKISLPAIEVSGNEWKRYGVDVNSKTVTNFDEFQYPFRLYMIYMYTGAKGKGDVLLDDIAAVGSIDKSRRVEVESVYQGIGYSPNGPLRISYRVRNAFNLPVSVPLKASLESVFKSPGEESIVSLHQNVDLPAHGEKLVTLDFGVQPVGAYESVLSARGADYETSATDVVAVFNPNGGRKNQSPMWFGVQHPWDWTSRIENEFLLDEFVVPLGIDAFRWGAGPVGRMNLQKDGTFVGFDAWNERTQLVLKHNLLLDSGFGSIPDWLAPPGKKDRRGEPADYDEYRKMCRFMAEKCFKPYADKTIAVEFYNEPDLPGFEFLPDFDSYAKMFKIFSEEFRAAGLKVGTGSVTVQHPKEKPGFSRRMYTELAPYYDVAVFHAHGELSNYTSRQKMVEDWMTTAGVPREKWSIGNSEAGAVSGISRRGRLQQAESLVQKMGWSRSQNDSLFHMWFQTNDAFSDQDIPSSETDTWGLVDAQQRLKPSGVAYNEVIRQLSNSKGLGEIDLDDRLTALSFQKPGQQEILFWPKVRGTGFVLPLNASGAVTVTDMFGRAQTLIPQSGKVTIVSNGFPMYISAPLATKIGRATAPGYATFAERLSVVPGKAASLDVTVKNIWKKPVTLKLAVNDNKNALVAERDLSLQPGATEAVSLSIPVSANTAFGVYGYSLVATSADAGVAGDLLPVTLVVAQRAVRGGPFVIDGKLDAIANVQTIRLDKATDMTDLAADPNTPLWKDEQDLSVEARFAHDDKGLYASFVVTDDKHNPGPATAGLWGGDSIQLGLSFNGTATEIGLTETGGGFGWVYLSPRDDLRGKALPVPVKAMRAEGRTTYEVYLPYELLGVPAKSGDLMRATFVANEDDGRGRVRVAKWFDGIIAAKSEQLMGYLELQ